jgi:hypothetical protein
MILGLVFFVLLTLAMKHELRDDQRSSMTDREKEVIKYQKQYLNLINKITRLQLSRENLPKKLIKQAQKIGQKGEIPEAFFKRF